MLLHVPEDRILQPSSAISRNDSAIFIPDTKPFDIKDFMEHIPDHIQKAHHKTKQPITLQRDYKNLVALVVNTPRAHPVHWRVIAAIDSLRIEVFYQWKNDMCVILGREREFGHIHCELKRFRLIKTKSAFTKLHFANDNVRRIYYYKVRQPSVTRSTAGDVIRFTILKRSISDCPAYTENTKRVELFLDAANCSSVFPNLDVDQTGTALKCPKADQNFVHEALERLGAKCIDFKQKNYIILEQPITHHSKGFKELAGQTEPTGQDLPLAKDILDLAERTPRNISRRGRIHAELWNYHSRIAGLGRRVLAQSHRLLPRD